MTVPDTPSPVKNFPCVVISRLISFLSTKMSMPQENDRKYFTNGVFDEDRYTADYLEWEAENDAKLTREREERQRQEDLELARADSMRKAGVTFAKNVIEHVIPAREIHKSRGKLMEAQDNIKRFLKSDDQTTSFQRVETVLASFKTAESEIEKIKIHCDYKEKVQMTTAEEKKVETLKDCIAAREKQVADSDAKAERLQSQIRSTEQKFDDDLERLRLEYETKVKTVENRRKAAIEKLEEEQRKSYRYASDVRAELNRLVSRLDEKVRPKVKLSMPDYTKLRTIKSAKLEKALADLNAWYDYLKSFDERLELEVEEFHGRPIHKIDDDELEGLVWLRDRYAYESIYEKHKTTIQRQLKAVRELLDNSEAEDD